jgi:DNA-binding PadR family transcriptional regulator
VYRITAEGDRYLARWVADLRETDRVLHGFLRAYDKQVQEGVSEHH